MSLLSEYEENIGALRRGTRRFVVLALLLLAGLIAAILVRQGLFRPTVGLGFVADSAQEISKGMAVKVAGFRVGSVSSMTLRDDGQVEVGLEIDADYLRFVTRDAVAELRHEGLVGSPVIEIVPGADRSRLAAADARLAFSRAEGLTAVANQLRAEIVPILRDVKAITGVLADPQQGVAATLIQLRQTTTGLQALMGTGNRQAEQLGTSAGQLMHKAGQDLDHLGQALGAINQRLPAMLDKTDKALGHVENLGAEAAATVPPLLREGNAVATDVRQIVGGAKQAWPIRNLIDAPGPAILTPDSEPRSGAQHAAQ